MKNDSNLVELPVDQQRISGVVSLPEFDIFKDCGNRGLFVYGDSCNQQCALVF